MTNALVDVVERPEDRGEAGNVEEGGEYLREGDVECGYYVDTPHSVTAYVSDQVQQRETLQTTSSTCQYNT